MSHRPAPPAAIRRGARSAVALAAFLGAALAGAHAATASNQDHLLIVDSGADRVMLFCPMEGVPLDVDWLTDLGAVGWEFTTPKEALHVGSEVWVTDQVADAIHRFSASDRSFIGSITSNENSLVFDNLRGMGYDGSKVYLCNFGAPIGPSIITIDPKTAAAVSTQSITGSPFDAEPIGKNEMLVSNGSGGVVQRYEIGGALLGNFATGFSTPQQVIALNDGSVLVAGSLGNAAQRGLHHFESDGSLRVFIPTTTAIGVESVRGAWLLGNGGYLLATAAGVWTVSPLENGFTFTQTYADADAQFVSLLQGNPCPADLDGCGTVNVMDLALLLGNWGNPGIGDLDNSGAVGSADLALLLGQWGPCPN